MRLPWIALHDWLKRRREDKVKKFYYKGYDFAAGALLRGEETPMSLESKIEWRIRYDNSFLDAFDRGCDMAMSDVLCNCSCVEDDREY